MIPQSFGWVSETDVRLGNNRARFFLRSQVIILITFSAFLFRFVLAMGSPVFETMFYGPVRQVSADSDIRIPDIEPESFRNLLRCVNLSGRLSWRCTKFLFAFCIRRYLYTDDLSGISERTVVSTLHAAKKYDIPPLKHACLEFMREIVRPENVFPLLAQVRRRPV